MNYKNITLCLFIVALTCFSNRLQAQPKNYHWSFNETQASKEFHGNFTQQAGVSGKCLNFDGFTTYVNLLPEVAGSLTNDFTVEAWIAPQEYSWGWTGIIDLAADTTSGISFGINYLGQIGFQAFANGKWIECISNDAVPLLQWSHVAGVFHPENGFQVFINGKKVADKTGKTIVKINYEIQPVIGKAQRKQYPALTERKNSKQFLSTFYFDGLIDEVSVKPTVSGEKEILASFNKVQPKEKQPLSYRKMPSGPKELKGFGAHYTQLQYCPEWDRLWPAGEYADVVVGFEKLPVRMVFWRGTGYCPAWVSSNDKWVSDQGPESWNWQTVAQQAGANGQMNIITFTPMQLRCAIRKYTAATRPTWNGNNRKF
ncbi:MAG: hypothetical protein FD181_2495 [Prolixibacteraceae bacterium]|nr:MAG: hypothetical protein FD181_2495 [Prolixibacteraceae bacterium]